MVEPTNYYDLGKFTDNGQWIIVRLYKGGKLDKSFSVARRTPHTAYLDHLPVNAAEVSKQWGNTVKVHEVYAD